MSATNRGVPREQGDYYATPAWVVDQLIAKMTIDDPRTWVIDPGCGDGAIMERMIVTAKIDPGLVIGIENDEARARLARERFGASIVLDSDFLDEEIMPYLSRRRAGPFLIVGNPPYSQAIEFAQQCLRIAASRPGGRVALLLRLGFLETPKRSGFHREYPAHIYVLPRRPSFCHSFKCKGASWTHRHEEVKFTRSTAVSKVDCPKCGARMSKTMSDATAYGWFVWGDNKPGKWEILT